MDTSSKGELWWSGKDLFPGFTIVWTKGECSERANYTDDRSKGFIADKAPWCIIDMVYGGNPWHGQANIYRTDGFIKGWDSRGTKMGSSY